MDASLEVFSYLFDSMPIGVVVLDQEGRVVIFNATEERLAGRSKARVLGRSFFEEVAPCMNVRDLGLTFKEDIGRKDISRELDFSFAFPHVDRPRDVRVRLQSFSVGSAPHALLLVEDVSAERAVMRMKESLQTLLVHDLKNPLASILANFGFALDDRTVKQSVDLNEAMRDGLMSAERLQALILNLLDVSRLETSTMPVQRGPTNLRAMLEGVVAGSRTYATLRGASVSVGSKTPTDPVNIDESLIRRCVENLVDNALRFARSVEVSAAVDGDRLEVIVADNGPGIPATIRERIFDRYVQVGGATGNTNQNRGLGLTFVRLAARAHGGEAVCECPAAGGTIFRLALPLQ